MDTKRKTLKWSMVRILILGWFCPLLFMIFTMMFLVNAKINKQVEKAIETSTEKVAEILQIQLEESEIASKNASYLPVIRNAYDEYRAGGEKRQFRDQVSLFLNQQYKYNRNFKAVLLAFPEYPDQSFYTYNNGKNGTYKDIAFMKEHVVEDVLAHMGDLDTATELIGYDGRIYMIRNLVDAKFRPYAVLIMELDNVSLLRSLSGIWGCEEAGIYMNEDLLLFSQTQKTEELIANSQTITQDVQYGEELGEKLAKKNIIFNQKSGKYSYLYHRMKLYNGNFDFAVKLDNSVIYAERQSLSYIFFMIIIFMAPLIGMIYTFFKKRVTTPIHGLVDAFDVVCKGDYGIQITNRAKDEEFFHMEESFNHMSLRLKEQFEKIFKEELALRDAKIMALQSQINPHFLNNTLEIINWEARLNENYRVSQMIEALSTMLEATMNRKEESLNTVTEEMVYVEAYLYIISQRFGEKFHYKKEVDESLLNYRIPRLIVQPIVENAVEHGMNRRQGEIIIRIFEKEEDILCIEIEDNGTLSEEDKKRIDRLLSEKTDPAKEGHVSLGIRNVDQRLKMLYGEKCGLFIENNKNNHTVSTILVKMNERKEQ